LRYSLVQVARKISQRLGLDRHHDLHLTPVQVELSHHLLALPVQQPVTAVPANICNWGK
jgi:hypothetical protein